MAKYKKMRFKKRIKRKIKALNKTTKKLFKAFGNFCKKIIFEAFCMYCVSCIAELINNIANEITQYISF